MALRDARRPGVVLAGVAAIGVVAGGLLGTQPGHGNPIVTPVLKVPTPEWHDGYNHFIVTVRAPLRPVAGEGSLAPRGERRPAGTKTAHRGELTGFFVPIKKSSASSGPTQAPAGSSGTALPAGSSGALPFGQWQRVTPNPAHPVVWRPGQPLSVLSKNLARFPKGTRLERDTSGNIRAVPPPGWHGWQGELPSRSPKPGSHKKTTPTRTPNKPTEPHTTPHKASSKLPADAWLGRWRGNLPPGWLPDARAVTASLLRVPGVHSASPVWATRYQVTTKLTAAQLSAVPGITHVTQNKLLSFFSSAPSTNDPYLSQEYYLANTGQTVQGQAGISGDSPDFSYAWARSRGSGILIADIDTGVDVNNPDLVGQISSKSMNFAVSPPTSDVEANGTSQGFYHGTTVDGVMVGTLGNGQGGSGAAPEAKVMALKCSDDDSLTDSCILSAGEYAIANGAKILNMSFGEQTSSDPNLAQLVNDARTDGVLVVAAAGNWGADNDTSPVLPANYADPSNANYSDNVISVGATDNQDNMSSFSDYGASSVNIMAPGTNLFTDYPSYTGSDYAYVSGTSYAAPLVSSAAALIWSVNSNLTYQQVRTDILNSATSVAGLSGKCSTGGRLNAQAALGLVTEPVQFTFTGFDELMPNSAISVSLNSSAQSGVLPTGQALAYRIELAYDPNGELYDVGGQNLTWSWGSSGNQAATTASDGTVLIAPSGLDSSSFSSNPLDLNISSPGLPSGWYALVATATNGTGSSSYGNPQAVFFQLGNSPLPTSSTTSTTYPSGGTNPTTTTAANTSTTAGSGTTSTSGAPTTTVPPTTAVTSPLPTVTSGSSTTLPTTTTITVPSTTTTATTSTTAASTTTTTAATTTTSSGVTTTTVASTTTTVPTTTTSVPTTTTTALTTTTAATTTTTAATTTTTAATTTTTSPASTTSTTGAFTINSVSPTQLPASGGSLSIFGTNLPPNPVVTVGAQNVAVADASSTQIDVDVPAMTSGTYAVTVYNATQAQQASLPAAVTIGTGSSGTTTTTSGGATTTTSAGGGTTTTTAAGSSTTTTTGASGTTTTTTTGTSTTTTTAATTTSGVTTTAGATTTTGAGGTLNGPPGTTMTPASSSDPLSAVGVGEWQAFTASQINTDNGAAVGSPVDGVDV